LNYIKIREGLSGPEQPVKLTLLGWLRSEEIKESGTLSRKCFIAMSCNEELVEIYENGVEIAVREAGYQPIFIEREQHNEKICDLIISEIRSCKFLVADVTLQRQNVYYEAGFAYGLNRTVIWTCRNNEIGNVHFDTRQYNHLTWENAEDLKIKLYSRIKATII
jgi:nucleoside 2-deoxyribosyltransferase